MVIKRSVLCVIIVMNHICFVHAMALEPTQETVFRAAARLGGSDLPTALQSIVFEYLKEPVFAISFGYQKPRGQLYSIRCFDACVERALTKVGALLEDVVWVQGCDYKMQPYVLHDVLAEEYDIGCADKKRVALAFDQSHPGAWFIPSDEERVLSVLVSDNAESKEAEFLLLQRLKQNSVKDRSRSGALDKSSDSQSWWEHVKNIVRRVIGLAQKEIEETMLQDREVDAGDDVSVSDESVTSAIMYASVFNHLKEAMVENSMVVSTLHGQIYYGELRRVFPWERIVYIQGKDKNGGRCIVFDKEFISTVPRDGACALAVSQEKLVALINGQEGILVTKKKSYF